MRAFWKQISTFQVILLGFLAVILLGSLLLMLPVSASAGTVTSFPNALFTATSPQHPPSPSSPADASACASGAPFKRRFPPRRSAV